MDTMPDTMPAERLKRIPRGDFLHTTSTVTAKLFAEHAADTVEEQVEKTRMIFDGICNSSMFGEGGCRLSCGRDEQQVGPRRV